MRLKLDSEFPQYLTEIGPSFVKKSKKLSWDQLGLDTSGLLNIWKQDSLKITHLSINFRFKQNFSVWYWLPKTRMWLSSDSLESNKSWYLFNISFKFPPIYFHTKFCNRKNSNPMSMNEENEWRNHWQSNRNTPRSAKHFSSILLRLCSVDGNFYVLFFMFGLVLMGLFCH